MSWQDAPLRELQTQLPLAPAMLLDAPGMRAAYRGDGYWAFGPVPAEKRAKADIQALAARRRLENRSRR